MRRQERRRWKRRRRQAVVGDTGGGRGARLGRGRRGADAAAAARVAGDRGREQEAARRRPQRPGRGAVDAPAPRRRRRRAAAAAEQLQRGPARARGAGGVAGPRVGDEAELARAQRRRARRRHARGGGGGDEGPRLGGGRPGVVVVVVPRPAAAVVPPAARRGHGRGGGARVPGPRARAAVRLHRGGPVLRALRRQQPHPRQRQHLQRRCGPHGREGAAQGVGAGGGAYVHHPARPLLTLGQRPRHRRPNSPIHTTVADTKPNKIKQVDNYICTVTSLIRKNVKRVITFSLSTCVCVLLLSSSILPTLNVRERYIL